jgi:hypothetical protein
VSNRQRKKRALNAYLRQIIYFNVLFNLSCAFSKMTVNGLNFKQRKSQELQDINIKGADRQELI